MSRMAEQQLYIHGGYTSATSGRTFETINPANGNVLATVQAAGREDVDRAVKSAQQGQKIWASMTAMERSHILRRAVDILRERNDELAKLETLDTGKAYSETSTVDIVTGADVLEYYAGLIPCLMSASVGYLIATLLGVSPTRFTVTLPALNVWTMFLVILLAIGCALVSILFVRGMHFIEHGAVKGLKNPYIRAAVGGFLIIGLTLLLGRDYNGAGMDIITRAVEQGQATPWAWFLKILFTAVTIGCGFKGGEVVPSFFVGATFGCVAAQALGLPGGFGAAIGLIAVFCGAVNCPIASVLLSMELFGSADGVLYFAFACAISYLLSGYCGLYSSQTILYSKLRAEFINVHAKE